jgi:hypothetical protein
VLAVKLRTTPGRGTERDWSAGVWLDVVVDRGQGLCVSVCGGNARGTRKGQGGKLCEGDCWYSNRADKKYAMAKVDD